MRAVMEEVRSREEAKKPDLPKLFKERDELRASINEHRSAIRKIQNEFNAEKKEYYKGFLEDFKHLEKDHAEEIKAIRAARKN